MPVRASLPEQVVEEVGGGLWVDRLAGVAGHALGDLVDARRLPAEQRAQGLVEVDRGNDARAPLATRLRRGRNRRAGSWRRASRAVGRLESGGVLRGLPVARPSRNGRLG